MASTLSYLLTTSKTNLLFGMIGNLPPRGIVVQNRRHSPFGQLWIANIVYDANIGIYYEGPSKELIFINFSLDIK